MVDSQGVLLSLARAGHEVLTVLGSLRFVISLEKLSDIVTEVFARNTIQHAVARMMHMPGS